ncbi:unnamed protein product [Vitrella brassicaformis CCMP3155]|uniref:Uncharacterized protein n=1 Tax=Vitrella brassicaformis (strain CCMP3155) TaxID=1169540 RepID=A0A0G4GV33_VITBC|nr:unnamed protein product [Vitrella brassicaformis CCMP3155]|eukprot:CEM34731.1 unnamed protein product [Vitrella brassicaformis CCMP3155]
MDWPELSPELHGALKDILERVIRERPADALKNVSDDLLERSGVCLQDFEQLFETCARLPQTYSLPDALPPSSVSAKPAGAAEGLFPTQAHDLVVPLSALESIAKTVWEEPFANAVKVMSFTSLSQMLDDDSEVPAAFALPFPAAVKLANELSDTDLAPQLSAVTAGGKNVSFEEFTQAVAKDWHDKHMRLLRQPYEESEAFRTAGSLVDALTEEAPDGFGLSAEDAQLLVAAAGTKGARDEEFTWQHYVRFLSVGGFELLFAEELLPRSPAV